MRFISIAIVTFAALLVCESIAQAQGDVFVSGDTILIIGTDAVDQLRINQYAGDRTFNFIFNGATFSFPLPGSVLVMLGGGDDRVISRFGSDEILVGIEIDGEDGDDSLRDLAGYATMRGGSGNDVMVLSGVSDVRVIAEMYGGDGNDEMFCTGLGSLFGGPGDDMLVGGPNEDTLYGGEGDDTIYGGREDDYLAGNEGNDLLIGGPDDDIVDEFSTQDFPAYEENMIFTQAGNDEVYVSFGANHISTGNGDDEVIAYSDAAASYIATGNGDDIIYCGDNGDTVYAGTGNDFISGGDGDDKIFCGAGDDTAFGARGNDELYGVTGADSLFGGRGDDLIVCGSGDDFADGSTGADIIYGNSGDDELIGDADDFIRQ